MLYGMLLSEACVELNLTVKIRHLIVLSRLSYVMRHLETRGTRTAMKYARCKSVAGLASFS